MASGEFELLREAARDQGVCSFYIPIFVDVFLQISKSTLCDTYYHLPSVLPWVLVFHHHTDNTS